MILTSFSFNAEFVMTMLRQFYKSSALVQSFLTFESIYISGIFCVAFFFMIFLSIYHLMETKGFISSFNTTMVELDLIFLLKKIGGISPLSITIKLA